MNIRILLPVIAGFLLTIFLLAVYGGIISRKTKDSDIQLNNLFLTYQPSVDALTGLNESYKELKRLYMYWSLSTYEKDSFFRAEYNLIFREKIFPLSNELLIISENWTETDQSIMKEMAMHLKDSLYIVLTRYVTYLHENVNHDTNQISAHEELPFLFSSIDQNLLYLSDKYKSMEQIMLTQIQADLSRYRNLTLKCIMLILFISLISIIINYRYLSKVYYIISGKLESLTSGHIPETLTYRKTDGFREIYAAMNKLFLYLRNLVNLSTRILEKDFASNFKPVGNNDQLGMALINLQNNLKKATEEEVKRQMEDSERQWVAEGVAIINDILRLSGDNIEDLSYQLIKRIVAYTGSNLGSMFIVNNDDEKNTFLEMTASYAYDRKKHIRNSVILGEGLVGRCAGEGETIYMTDIPAGYLSIQSGLGESNPFALLLVPLKLNDSVYGAIELASFADYASYQIRFMEIIGENIAVTISKLKINLRTSNLLEQTRQQAEELSSQEEEMRQSMEELRANQEQAAFREEKLLHEIQYLKSLLGKQS